MSRRVCLAKFGGGLITDKTRPEVSRPEVIGTLAAAFAEARATSDCSWVLGHGSGSFGHQAARGSILAGSTDSSVRACSTDADRMAVARTADAAARLHRILFEALVEASVPCFSWLVSSVATGLSEPSSIGGAGVRRLLEEGLVPLTMGDVVVGGPGGTEIWSTERVLSLLVADLIRHEWRVERVLWFGNTDGILDSEGATLDQVGAEDLERVRRLAGDSDGVDVTGGMRLRLETCAALAERGVESWILDGRDEQVVRAGFRGIRLRGTRFAGASGDRRTPDRGVSG